MNSFVVEVNFLMLRFTISPRYITDWGLGKCGSNPGFPRRNVAKPQDLKSRPKTFHQKACAVCIPDDIVLRNTGAQEQENLTKLNTVTQDDGIEISTSMEYTWLTQDSLLQPPL